MGPTGGGTYKNNCDRDGMRRRIQADSQRQGDSLYSFCPRRAAARRGIWPSAGLVFDQKGNLYGTANHGGALWRWGVVFKLTP